MKIVLTPNPYRDKQFRTVQQAKKILESCGVETVMCLPFDVDRDYELPKTMDFRICTARSKTPICWSASEETARFSMPPKLPPRTAFPFLG